MVLLISLHRNNITRLSVWKGEWSLEKGDRRLLTGGQQSLSGEIVWLIMHLLLSVCKVAPLKATLDVSNIHPLERLWDALIYYYLYWSINRNFIHVMYLKTYMFNIFLELGSGWKDHEFKPDGLLKFQFFTEFK